MSYPFGFPGRSNSPCVSDWADQAGQVTCQRSLSVHVQGERELGVAIPATIPDENAQEHSGNYSDKGEEKSLPAPPASETLNSMLHILY